MVVHAELNSLLNSHESLEGCTLYVTPLPPCAQCAAAIIQRGIAKVVIEQKKELSDIWEKKFKVAETMFKEAGVFVCVMPYNATQANDNKEAGPTIVPTIAS